MRLSLWPQSLFGRLIAASIVALLLAQVVSLVLVARERERFILQGTMREWSRRIAEVTIILQGLDDTERAATVAQLSERPWRELHGRDAKVARPGLVPFTQAGDFAGTFAEQLRATLGPGYAVSVVPTPDLSKRAITISGPSFAESRDGGTELYDATVKFPDGYATLFRVTRLARGAPLPRGLFMNLALLGIVMSIALFATARSITRPLSELARAADSVGRDLRHPKIAERGAREIRNAARAFNTMQDRLQRYLDSRSRVLAAMSHDLKTPLTRLRLQVEMLDDATMQGRLAKQLDEMESMVHGALALFKGLDDNEAYTPIDIDAMLATLRSEFAGMSAEVSIKGHATRPILGKPQALRRCLTNLIANAVKFGSQARVVVADGAALTIRVCDDGPGIPEDELERVFEPFYRLESSRNRDTGGSGLGLSIARDVIQAHGGSLILRNLPVRGLEARVTLPRA